MIASLDVKYYKNTNTNERDYENAYNFHLYNGILFHVESVLSCFSNEYYMVYDHYNALQNLNHVFIHLPSNRNDLLTSPPYFFVDIQRYAPIYNLRFIVLKSKKSIIIIIVAMDFMCICTRVTKQRLVRFEFILFWLMLVLMNKAIHLICMS